MKAAVLLLHCVFVLFDLCPLFTFSFYIFQSMNAKVAAIQKLLTSCREEEAKFIIRTVSVWFILLFFFDILNSIVIMNIIACLHVYIVLFWLFFSSSNVMSCLSKLLLHARTFPLCNCVSLCVSHCVSFVSNSHKTNHLLTRGSPHARRVQYILEKEYATMQT